MVAITSDKGLCGGINSTVCKQTRAVYHVVGDEGVLAYASRIPVPHIHQVVLDNTSVQAMTSIFRTLRPGRSTQLLCSQHAEPVQHALCKCHSVHGKQRGRRRTSW